MAASSALGRREPVALGPVAFSGFPVRGLTRRLGGDGGEWVSAYQAEQRSRLKAVLSPSVRRATGKSSPRPPTNTREASGLSRQLLPALDEPFLLKHCYVERPGDLCMCNISGAGLEVVRKSEDFEKFESVVYINASDNHLPLEAFVGFPVLSELELSLNSIVDVSIALGGFTTLQTLDLSFNFLSGVSLLALGVLPALKELRLTGNNLVALPVDMSRLYSIANEDSSRARYPALERLWLDDNKLTDQTTFATLAGLRRLKYLNLDDNEIYVIPELKLLDSSSLPLPPLHTGATGITIQATDRSQDSLTKDAQPLSETVAPGGDTKERSSRENTPSPLHITTLPLAQNPMKAHRRNPLLAGAPHLYSHAPPLYSTAVQSLNLSSGGNSERDIVGEESCFRNDADDGNSLAPFPKLETLSLVNNLILTSEGVLACASWPVLQELVVHGNPLTRACKGMPPLLQTHLVEQCGVRVVRNKPSEVKQFSIGKAAKDFKKISSAPPPFIPRQPLPAIEAPPTSDHMMLKFSPSPPHSFATSPSSSQLSSEGGEDGEGGEDVVEDTQEQQEGIFMTQVAGEDTATQKPCVEEAPPTQPTPQQQQQQPVRSGQSWSGSAAFKAHLSEVKQRFSHAPDRYRGYEALLDTYADPTMNVPLDAHSCTRALQYALKHPLVLPNATQHSSSLPVHARGEYLKKKSSPSLHRITAAQHPNANVRELQVVLDDIHTHCNTLETNLADALMPESLPTQRSASRLQRENRKLLSEMQARYDKVRSSSLQSLRSATRELGAVSPARSKKPAFVQRTVRFSENLT